MLVIFDFDMIFYFCMGWLEGVAHDSRMLNEAISDPANNFPFPPVLVVYIYLFTVIRPNNFVLNLSCRQILLV